MEEPDADEIVKEFVEDNKNLIRDTASEAESVKRRRKETLISIWKVIRCDYPFYLYCFCINPLGCMKSLQAVILNWLAITAAVTLISVYCSSTLLELFTEHVVIFMYLGVGCLWTAVILLHHMQRVAKLGKNLDESVEKLMHTEDDIQTTMAVLDLRHQIWTECVDDFHEANKGVRKVGRLLDYRKKQAEQQAEELEELIVRYGGRVTADLLRRREAINRLINEQGETLGAVSESIGEMQQEHVAYDEGAARFKQEIEYLKNTIGSMEKPIDDLRSLKPQLHKLGADPKEFKDFVTFHIQYLSVLERITILREMTYSQTIFFQAIRQNEGQIDEGLFKKLISRLPKVLREGYERTGLRYRDYRCVVSKGTLGWTKYGGMDEAGFIKFMKDLEARTFDSGSMLSTNMPNPKRIGYGEDDDSKIDKVYSKETLFAIMESGEEEGVEHEEENAEKQEEIVITTS